MNQQIISIQTIIEGLIRNNISFSFRHYKNVDNEFITEFCCKYDYQNAKLLFPKHFVLALDDRQTTYGKAVFRYV